MMKRWLLLICAASVVSASGFNAVSAATEEAHAPIKIGFVASLSGVAAPSGKDMVKGIQLWLSQRKGRVAGRQVELVVENDESSAATAVAKVRKLVEVDKVNVVGGYVLAPIARAAGKIAEELQIPSVSALSGGEDISPKLRLHWGLHSSATLWQQLFPFGNWCAKKLGYRRVATFAMDYPFGYTTVGSFQKSFEDAGGKVVQKIWAPLGFTDFEKFIKEIRPDVDAVFVVTTSNAARIFAQQYMASGPKLPIIGFGSSVDESILSGLSAVPVGALTCSTYSSEIDTPGNKAFVHDFQTAYNGPKPGLFAESGYVTGLFIEKAIESLKGEVSDKNRFLAALRKVELSETPSGPVKLDAKGDPIVTIYVRKLENSNGGLRNVVAEEFPKTLPYWKYNANDFNNFEGFSRDNPACRYCSK